MMRSLHWFRNDLRLTDNPALIAASENDVLPVYILDSEDLKDMGQASKLWLHHSLNQLNETLEGKLHFIQGDSINEIRKLIDSEQIDAIYWNRVFEPKKRSKDNDLIKSLEIDYHIFNGSLLWEPESILKDDGTPYKVFTPFYRKGCIKAGKTPREPLPKAKLNFISAQDQTSLDELNLLPVHPWKKKIESKWEMGEDSAMKRLDDFLENGIQNYKEGRNYPAKSFVSRLSPHLHFGELSPNQIWFKTRAMGDDKNIDHFCSELGWREFSHYLIHHFSFMLKENLNSNFDAFPWENNADFIQSWKLGETGYPIVDAGMKELWETGYMHNRVRMIVGSFLVKNLLAHWSYGRDWFNECLVDADLANNTASWQWVAGTGADAAPYFRIFNPVKQGQDFDKDGEYTKKYLPQLSKMPDKYLFNPWEAPKELLADAGVKLGENYPHPIVELKSSRENALASFDQIKKKK